MLFRSPYARTSTQLTQPSASQEGSTRIAINVSSATTFIDYLRQTLESILVTSINNYNTQVKTNSANSQLEAFSTEVLHEQTTAKTAEQMDFSPSVSPQELEELIAKSTSKAVSSLSREIQSLKSKLENTQSTQTKQKSKNSSSNQSSKNSSQRGRTSASLKKKNTTSNTPRSRSSSPNTKRSRSRSAKSTRKKHGDKSRDSSNDRRNKPNRNGKQRSSKKPQSSRPNSRQN